jgi:hypothetical protein
MPDALLIQIGEEFFVQASNILRGRDGCAHGCYEQRIDLFQLLRAALTSLRKYEEIAL